MKIGNKLTQEEFNDFKKDYKKYTFGADYYVFNDDLRFERKVDSDILYWELVSTHESRVKDRETGHPNIHRPEQRKFKRYYEGKS